MSKLLEQLEALWLMHKFLFYTLPEFLGATLAILTMILTYMNINPLELF